MKIASVTAFIAATLATVAVAVHLPEEHRERFLREQASIEEELAAWKASDAGQYALEHGLITESSGSSKFETSSLDQVTRFFLTKVSIEEAQALNPDAVLSTDSPFTLLTDDEFAAFVSRSSANGAALLVDSGNSTATATDETEEGRLGRRNLATTVDWTTSGCVSDVKDQGYCGSCWAFSATGALESAYCIAKGSLTLFSDEQVTSCDSVSSGCDGGWPLWGLNYIKSAGYICTEDSYPFTSGDEGVTGTCKASSCSSKTSVTIKSITTVSASESALVTAVTKQPVAVAVAAGNTAFKQYTSGVLSSCSTSTLDHAILAVGYDSTSFKLKNQWGTSWGNSGYINLKRNGASSACSVVNTHNVYPNLG
jgi:C1A family cysteine protease